MATQPGGFSFNNFLGTSAMGDMRIDIDELESRALFIDGTKSMAGTLGMASNLIVGFSAIEGVELGVGILPATGHVSIYAKTDKNVYIQDDTGLETNITGGGSGLVGVTDTENSLYGVGSGTSITGDSNLIAGFNAANFSTGIGESVILGAHACENALAQGRGVFIGANCGLNADMTSGTVAVGFNSMQNLSGSTGNTCAYGFESLQACTSGGGNSAYGALSLKNLTTSVLNTAVGRFTMNNIKAGSDSNVGCGAGALSSIGLGELGLGIGSSNTACGTNSLGLLGGQTGVPDDHNSALGRSAGISLLFGSNNVYLGALCGGNHGDASPGENNNILIGKSTPGVLAEQNTIHLGNFATHTSCFVAGISGTPSGTPVACIQDPLTGEIGAGQVQMSGSGDMSMINAMDINGDGQILLQTSQIAADAIKINATGGAIDIDAVSFIDIATSLANTQALKLTTSDPASGMIFSCGLGGFEMTSTGNYDWHTSIDQAGQGISFRATGTQGEIQLDAGTGGVRIMDITGLFINDSTSNFQQQITVPTMTADQKWTLPVANAVGVLTNATGDGTLTWVGGTNPDATGVIAGGFLTVDVDTTEFSISNGNGIIYNPVTEVKTVVTWTGLTAQTFTYLGDESFISIDSDGLMIHSTTLPTNSEIRADIYLGQIVHLDQTNIVATIDEQMTLLSGENQTRDFMQAIGELKISGNLLSSNSLLTIAKSAGDILKFGGNFANDVNNPHLPESGALDTNVADTFAYRWQDGTFRLSLTDIVPSEFDDGNGESAPGTVTSQRWSVQRVFTFSIGQMVIQQAQFTYGTEALAVAAINTEGFIIEPELAVSAVLIGFLAVKGNATDLSSADATFLEAGKFGGNVVQGSVAVSGPDIIREYGSNDFLNSTDAAWEISDLAPSIPDPSFAALSVRAYDSVTSEAVGMKLSMPSDTISIDVRIVFRRSSAAGGSIKFDLLAYDLDSGGATSDGSWNIGNVIHNATPASTEVLVKITTNFTLTSLGLSPDEDCLLQISRDIADTYAADVYLVSCQIVQIK